MKENQLYNDDIKEKYLSTFENEDTQRTIRYILYKAQPMEISRQRDLYDFNIEEIGNVIKNYANPKNMTVAKSTVRFLSGYISWACDIGLRENGMNPLDKINEDEAWLSSLVDTTKKIHYSEQEFLTLINKLSNDQDKAFLMLMFEGITGFSQLASLKDENIDWTNNSIIIDGKEIKVSEKCMEYMRAAFEEKVYDSFIEKENRHNKKELIPSEYLFKNIRTPRISEGKEVGQSVLYSRLNQIRKEFQLEYLTPNAIRQSGMIKMCADILSEKIEIGLEPKMEYVDFEKIGDRYGLSKISANNHVYYNTTIMKEWISESNLKDLYNINVQF